MHGVWTVAEIRAAEERAIAELRPVPDGDPGLPLMLRAAAGLAGHCRRLLGRGYGARVVLLIGAGHNGGDALYAGVSLLRRGVTVHAVLLAPDRVHVPGILDFAAAGGTVGGADGARERMDRADLVVDGIAGIGGRGALRSPADTLFDGLVTPVVACDLPSGVEADTGATAGAHVRAASTVTFGGRKAGLLVGAGAAAAGTVELVDIGLGHHLPAPATGVLETADVAALLAPPGRTDDKYSRGVVGVVSGSAAYEGAAVLSVGGALRTRPGMVRYAGSAAAGVRAAWPEAVVTDGRPTDAGRVQAWVVGPGLGTDEHATGLVAEVLRTDAPVVVDADGLTVLAAHPGWTRDRAAGTVLTPHDREFERIFGTIGDDRLGAARRAAAASGAVVLLKGAATVVAAPDGRARINPTGTPWLATAGTGDVLSGILGALLATGADPLLAAAAAAYVHGAAAQRASAGGPILASDLYDALPATLAALSPA